MAGPRAGGPGPERVAAGAEQARPATRARPAAALAATCCYSLRPTTAGHYLLTAYCSLLTTYCEYTHQARTALLEADAARGREQQQQALVAQPLTLTLTLALALTLTP
eukprot:scaffold34860_cov52-Phaeocystis_antarctica.AAC.1